MRGLAGKYHKGGFQGIENILCILTEYLVHEFSLLLKLTALEDNDDCQGHHLPTFTSPKQYRTTNTTASVQLEDKELSKLQNKDK